MISNLYSINYARYNMYVNSCNPLYKNFSKYESKLN